MSNIVDICCSCCGKHKRTIYSATNVLSAADQGWRSYSGCLYCPECSASWHERNKTKLNNIKRTVIDIDNVYRWQYNGWREDD